MGLFDLFRKPRPVADAESLDDFLAGQTAFLVQKTTWEYSRARSGVLWQKLFKEEAFKAAIERSTWANYPLALSFVGEMVASTLRNDGADADRVVPWVAAACRRVAAAHRPPAGVADEVWTDADDFVAGRLNRTLVAPPKAVKDIPLDGHRAFFDRLPMHPDLTRHDGQLLQNTLRIHLCRAHEDLLARVDRQRLAAALDDGPAPRAA